MTHKMKCDRCKNVDLYKMQEVNVTDEIDHVNCPYRKDVVCASNKDKNCVMCDIYKQVFGEEDQHKEAEKEEDITVKLCDICKYKNVLPECNPYRSCGAFNNFESKEDSE